MKYIDELELEIRKYADITDNPDKKMEIQECARHFSDWGAKYMAKLLLT